MATNTFTPTDEQLAVVDAAKTGGSVAVNALAGAGKTSTLQLIAEALKAQGKRGQYLAFNKKIVTDVKGKFPGNVDVSTAHSLAMRSVGRSWCRPRLDTNSRMSQKQLAEALGLDGPMVLDRGTETIEVAAETVASIAHRAVLRFCETAEDTITTRHVPWQKGLDTPGEYDVNNQLAARVTPLARRIWADVSNRDRMPRFRFEHGHYLKLWQLSDPVIYSDFVLFDEAQDASHVMLDIVQRQGIQVVWVGDSHQMIYEWAGAVDAMALARVDHSLNLTKSFRFGPEIAEQANLVLDRLGSTVKVEGAGKPGSVGPDDEPDCFLGRTNAAVVGRAMKEIAAGRRVYVQGGLKELRSFCGAARKLQNGQPTTHVELACFRNWDEVLAYVETDDGQDLRSMVMLVEDYGPDDLLAGMEDAASGERYADVTLSTAHKSKGGEWDSVSLLGDFPPAARQGDEELRLMYVAATRAKRHLDRSMVDLEGLADDS